jgi:hypothetical protein
MLSCYTYTKHSVEKQGMLDGAVDATYVLTMDESDRLANVIAEFDTRPLTSRYTVQYNRGYKRCAKPAWVKATMQDIFHAHATACEHALSEGHEQILVLEDDFETGEDTAEHAVAVRQFLIDNRGEFDLYNMGHIYAFSFPFYDHHRTIGSSLPQHSVVYGKKVMEAMVAAKNAGSYLGGVDLFAFGSDFRVYTYKRPIVYQTFPATANMATWPGVDPEATKWFLKKFKLDVSTENYVAVAVGLTVANWLLVFLGILLLSVTVVCCAVVATKLTKRRTY